jgi:hypothetical protein
MRLVSETVEFCIAVACTLLLWAIGAGLLLADRTLRAR